MTANYKGMKNADCLKAKSLVQPSSPSVERRYADEDVGTLPKDPLLHPVNKKRSVALPSAVRPHAKYLNLTSD